MKYQDKLQFIKELREDLKNYKKELSDDLDILERTFRDIRLDRKNIAEEEKRIAKEEEELSVMEFENE